ncbi:hypothetical protein KLA_16642 [Cellulophaga geojensis KL-A]|uniref:Uncharacterized protein n=1 Tax=Cellulophaga geojensis KL-A TaxID=1328323 RepID=A0ABN0RJJ9_9FLAO|nr:hypothetical protein KLA_16642 [Cellulophaga geojensis KL-A]
MSCAQNTKTTKNMNTADQDTITIHNVTDKMWQAKPKYNEQPMYLLRINQEYCTYEVLVNDFPVKEYYRSGKLATAIKINRAILKSGPQKVTIRMYPYGDLLQQEFGEDQPYMNTLNKGSSMLVEVIKVPDWKNYTISKEESIKVVKPEGYDNQEFVGAGLPFYEFSFSFNAKVPFEFEGWSNGIDLRKVDSTLLKQKIISYFKSYQKKYEEKDVNAIVNLEYNNVFRTSFSEYERKDQINGLWEENNEGVNIKDKEFQPLQNYELAFFGEGKIATLKFGSNINTDSRYRGASTLYFTYKNKSGRLRGRFLGVYLYMDKDKYTGKDEDIQLEMIK